jgi:hypothetical protein
VARAPKFKSEFRREYQLPLRAATPAGLRALRMRYSIETSLHGLSTFFPMFPPPSPELTEPISAPHSRSSAFRSRSFAIIRNRSRTFAIIRAISLPRGYAWPRTNHPRSFPFALLCRWSDGPPELVSSFLWLPFVHITNLASNLYYPDQDECTAKRKKIAAPLSALSVAFRRSQHFVRVST